jgi:hypothetical protein
LVIHNIVDTADRCVFCRKDYGACHVNDMDERKTPPAVTRQSESALACSFSPRIFECTWTIKEPTTENAPVEGGGLDEFFHVCSRLQKRIRKKRRGLVGNVRSSTIIKESGALLDVAMYSSMLTSGE